MAFPYDLRQCFGRLGVLPLYYAPRCDADVAGVWARALRRAEQNNPTAAKVGGHKLPSTFYMSTYKRFTSYFETGRCYPIVWDDGSNF